MNVYSSIICNSQKLEIKWTLTSEQITSCDLLTHGISLNNEKNELGFPGGSVVGNLSASAGDKGLIPDQGRPHMPQSTSIETQHGHKY